MFAKITCPTGLRINCYSEDALVVALANIQAYHECRIDSQVPLSDLIDNISPAPTAFQQHATPTPTVAADAAQPDERVALTKDDIREIFMAHGFTIKEGQADLKQYVYDAAYALLARATAPQAQPDERAAPTDSIPLHEDMLRALEHVECVYRQNVVKDGEPSSTLANLQRVIARARATAPQAQPDERAAFLDIVFDGPPSHESGRFVEVEDAEGHSVSAGEWIDRGNGLWALRISRATAPQASPHPEYTRGWQDCLSMYIAPQATVKGDERDRVRDAIAEAIGGDAYDGTRVWTAWSVGTMSEDDFSAIVSDESRLYEIADAAIRAAVPQAGATLTDEQRANPTSAARLTHPEITVAKYHWALSRINDYRLNDLVPAINNPTRIFGDGDIARLICKLIEEQETLERSGLYNTQMAGISTAALGYFTGCAEPYKTAALNDVHKLWLKYSWAHDFLNANGFEQNPETFHWRKRDSDQIEQLAAVYETREHEQLASRVKWLEVQLTECRKQERLSAAEATKYAHECGQLRKQLLANQANQIPFSQWPKVNG